MSQKLITHSLDLKKLSDEGYEVRIADRHICVDSVPYVNEKKEIKSGTLVSPFELSGDTLLRPTDHVIYFRGDHPCNKDGSIIEEIKHQSSDENLGGELVNHSFSNKPQEGYTDYYKKFTNYIKIIESPARSINQNITARTYKNVESTEPNSPLFYRDTNSSRARITGVSEKFSNMNIGIIGLGGTGSYVLDFIAKTPVREIHLFDEDDLLNHNAFRIPGAVPFETLKTKPKKVNYLSEMYSKIHKKIMAHEYKMDESRLDEIGQLKINFVFLCSDDKKSKSQIIQKLNDLSVTFIDTGIGIYESEGMLNGRVRITTATKDKKSHIEKHLISSDGSLDDYDRNIQIAEINAINAILAIIKWKKLYGIYHDDVKEHESFYDINTNKIINYETGS